MAPRVLVMGQATAEAYLPTGREVCISITTPGTPEAALSHRFDAVLRLAFSDFPWDDRPEWREHCISEADAERLAAFLIEHWHHAETVVVHCMVGASRSVSVALAIEYAMRGECWTARLNGDSSMAPLPGHIPNKPVYRRVGRALRAAGFPVFAPTPEPRP